MKHYNIPIFIPELACPNRCIYCNQRYISGQLQAVKPEEIKQIIKQHLTTFIKPSHVELAFFGGSFTGIDEKDMIKYLEVVQPYIEQGEIKSIRISTRPDYINEKVLSILKQYNVLSDEELRGVKKVLKAAAMTYVASALVAIGNLFRLIFIAKRRR
jgi:histone acetyltransferase (RNA polymerase elongator complex component)